MKIAVITIAAGRHTHLRMQRAALVRSSRLPDLHVVVAMDDPDISEVTQSIAMPANGSTLVVDVPRVNGRLPLAHARNVGAQTALDWGADLLVFLDVDCLPDQLLIERYIHAAAKCAAPTLLSGPVTYLPPPPDDGYDLSSLSAMRHGHPVRPIPSGDDTADADHRLFWTLSFAVESDIWRLLGGFHPKYVGYGGEDTDFGQVAAAKGVRHTWVGGAWAYHQYHPVNDPPLEHLDDIMRNASIFHQRWGWWPMRGWLDEFERLGLAHHDLRVDAWTTCAPSENRRVDR